MSGDLIQRLADALPDDHPIAAEARIFLARHTPLETLPLSTRVRNALLRGGFRSVEELWAAGPKQWSSLPGIGTEAVKEISQALADH